MTLDHPFWAFHERAVRRQFKPDTPQETFGRLRELGCKLFAREVLDLKWRGMEIGNPRPKSLVGRTATEQNRLDSRIFAFEFFRMVESGETFGEPSSIEARYGRPIEEIVGKTSGLHYSLEIAYWTFLIKWDDCTKTNIEEYGCPLVCHMDSILAYFNCDLRSRFFPMPGPIKLPRWFHKREQKRFLKMVAPHIADELHAEICS